MIWSYPLHSTDKCGPKQARRKVRHLSAGPQVHLVISAYPGPRCVGLRANQW